MTQLTLDCFPYIRAPIAERDLRPPETIDRNLIAEPSYFDEDKSLFRFRIRKNSFCNQYLLVAETEKEDTSGLINADAEQQIKELKKQVGDGFTGVQKQLKLDKEAQRLSKSSSMDVDSQEFKQAVESAVEERLADI